MNYSHYRMWLSEVRKVAQAHEISVENLLKGLIPWMFPNNNYPVRDLFWADSEKYLAKWLEELNEVNHSGK